MIDIEKLEIEEIELVKQISDFRRKLAGKVDFWRKRSTLRALKQAEKELQEIKLTLRLESKQSGYQFNIVTRDRYFDSFITDILNPNRPEDPVKDFLRDKNLECYNIGLGLFGPERMEQIEQGSNMTRNELDSFTIAFKESFSTGRLKEIQDTYLKQYPGLFIPVV